MKLFSTAIALIVAAVYGGIIAAVMGGLATITSGDRLFNEPVRTIEIVIGVISGAIGGGCLAYQGKGDRKYGFGLFVKIALISSGLPLLRLAIHQNHGPTALVFGLLGSFLFLTGCVLILDIVSQTEGLAEKMLWLTRRLAPVKAPLHLMTYLPAGLALLLVGAYLMIGIELTCRRPEPSLVDCLLEHYRWLGLVKVEEVTLKGLHDWRPESGDRVLIAQSGEATIPSRINTFYFEMADLDTFLASTEPTLSLSSVPDWWILIPVVLLASLLFVAGLLPNRF